MSHEMNADRAKLLWSTEMLYKLKRIHVYSGYAIEAYVRATRNRIIIIH